jgi:hypothetical protein
VLDRGLPDDVWKVKFWFPFNFTLCLYSHKGHVAVTRSIKWLIVNLIAGILIQDSPRFLVTRHESISLRIFLLLLF